MIPHTYENDDRSIIQIVDDIITKAVGYSASDVHFESLQQGIRIRFRIDGVLYDQKPIPQQLALQTITRIKILAHINIAEKRIPQDGKFRIHLHDQDIDCRVSTFPSLYGEKVVVRILDRAQHTIALENLGFQESMLQQFTNLLRRSNGFFLVTGPTGSGKTTTLYAALSALHAPEKNIITLEDPVEYTIDGITQGQIHPDAGFTFERGIRALLRQDPDIAMVGEIRDKQTARIAIEASLTGHLVFSTLHTNDAPTAIMRLMDMGIEPFLINASVTGVLAQRLARKICTTCRIAVQPTEEDTMILQKLAYPLEILYKGRGCAQCFNFGYKGRIGIFELLIMSNNLRALIIQHPLFDVIYSQVIKDGMQTLLQDGLYKVAQGIITLQELMRVVY